jgi:hypothetical protein
MCNGLNLCTIFWKSDLVNGTSAYECEIARNATPEAQECGCSGTALLRCRLSAAFCWTFLLRLDIDIRCVIAAVISIGAISGVAVVGTSNKDGARIGNKRAELPKSCMRLGCGKVENLSSDLRVGAGRVACRFGINQWPGAT